MSRSLEHGQPCSGDYLMLAGPVVSAPNTPALTSPVPELTAH